MLIQPTEITYLSDVRDAFLALEARLPNVSPEHDLSKLYVICMPSAIRSRFLNDVMENKGWNCNKLYGNMFHPFNSSWSGLSNIEKGAFNVNKTYNKYEMDALYRFHKDDAYFYLFSFSEAVPHDRNSRNQRQYLLMPDEYVDTVKKMYDEYIVKYLTTAVVDASFEPLPDFSDTFDEEGYIITDEFKFLYNDIDKFLNNREFYEKNKLQYKRGVLLVGSPGNGKTHALKYIKQHFKIPIVVPGDMRDFEHYIDTSFGVIKTINKITGLPAILFVEEVNVVMHENNGRERFLELLDGIDTSYNFYFIGTTNKPEDLDAAILDRPSRIDNILTINSPKREERITYFTKFFPEWNDKQLAFISDTTDGFSFVYMKNTVIEYIYECENRDVYKEEVLKKIIKRQTDHMKNNAAELTKVVDKKRGGRFGFSTTDS